MTVLAETLSVIVFSQIPQEEAFGAGHRWRHAAKLKLQSLFNPNEFTLFMLIQYC